MSKARALAGQGAYTYPIMRLLVPRRVPVGIKHDDCVGTSERNAQGARARRQEVDELVAPLAVEHFDFVLAPGQARVAVEAHESMAH